MNLSGNPERTSRPAWFLQKYVDSYSLSQLNYGPFFIPRFIFCRLCFGNSIQAEFQTAHEISHLKEKRSGFLQALDFPGRFQIDLHHAKSFQNMDLKKFVIASLVLLVLCQESALILLVKY